MSTTPPTRDLSPKKLWLFRLFPSAVALVVAGIGLATFPWWQPEEGGVELNRQAWKATFTERGIDPPSDGPREGYWGVRLWGATVPDETLGWRNSEIHVEGLVRIDERGLQHVPCPGAPCVEVLITGGSVGWGAYASSIATTYFSRVVKKAAAEGWSLGTRVFAAGGWKAEQEALAIRRVLEEELRPDVVAMVTGLNDLINGATATDRTFSDLKDQASGWHEHAGDWSSRVAMFLEVVRRTVRETGRFGIPLLVVFQPALFEKEPLSDLEEQALDLSVDAPGEARSALEDIYSRMREALQMQERETRGLHTADCADIFDGVEETTFTDMWHFADVGHDMLAGCILDALREVRGEVRVASGSGDGAPVEASR